MERRTKQSPIGALATMPWPIGILAGIVGFILVRYGIQWFLSFQGGMLAQAFAQQSSAVFAPLAWILLVICWIAALGSYLNDSKRRRFLDTRTTLESLAAGDWRPPNSASTTNRKPPIYPGIEIRDVDRSTTWVVSALRREQPIGLKCRSAVRFRPEADAWYLRMTDLSTLLRQPGRDWPTRWRGH